MAWCKVSSLTAAVARTLKGAKYPMTRKKVLEATAGRTIEGWEIEFFLRQALKKRSYGSLRAVMLDLEFWLESQG